MAPTEPTPSSPGLSLWGARTGNCLRAAIGLAEAGIPHTIHRLDLRRGEHRGAEHRLRNPAGKVPVLTGNVEGRLFALTQSNAILLYADQVAPGRLLPGLADPTRMVTLERFFFFVTDVIAPNYAAFTLQRAHMSEGAAVLTKKSIEAIMLAETFASEAPYLAGEGFSLADIAALTVIASLADQLPWPELPHLDAWFQRTFARPAVQQGWRAFDEPAAQPAI